MEAIILPPNICPHCHKPLKSAQGVATHITNQADCQQAAAAAKALQRMAASALGPILTATSANEMSVSVHEPHSAAWEDADVQMSDIVPQVGNAEGVSRYSQC